MDGHIMNITYSNIVLCESINITIIANNQIVTHVFFLNKTKLSLLTAAFTSVMYMAAFINIYRLACACSPSNHQTKYCDAQNKKANKTRIDKVFKLSTLSQPQTLYQGDK